MVTNKQTIVWFARLEAYWHSYDLVAYGHSPEEAMKLLRAEYFKQERIAKTHLMHLNMPWKQVVEDYGIAPQKITVPSSSME